MSTVNVTRGQRSSWACIFYQEGVSGPRLSLVGATVTAVVPDASLSFPVTITDAAQGEVSIRVDIPSNTRLGIHQLRIVADLPGGDQIPWPSINLQVGE